MPGQILEFAEAAPMKAGDIGRKESDASIRAVALLEEGDAVPVDFKSGAETEATGIGREFAGEVDDNGLGFSGGRAGDDWDGGPY